MKISYSEFLDTVKVLRMLYGVNVATVYFERNFEEFTGNPISSLRQLKKID